MPVTIIRQREHAERKHVVHELEASRQSSNDHGDDARDVEWLLLRGVSDPSTIARKAGIPESKVRGYIERLHISWELDGNPPNHRRLRGQAMRRLDLIEQLTWSIVPQVTTPQLKLAIINQLLHIHDRWLEISGLSPVKLEKIDQSPRTFPDVLQETPEEKLANDMKLDKFFEQYSQTEEYKRLKADPRNARPPRLPPGSTPKDARRIYQKTTRLALGFADFWMAEQNKSEQKVTQGRTHRTNRTNQVPNRKIAKRQAGCESVITV